MQYLGYTTRLFVATWNSNLTGQTVLSLTILSLNLPAWRRRQVWGGGGGGGVGGDLPPYGLRWLILLNAYLLLKPQCQNLPFFVSKPNYSLQPSVSESTPRAPESRPPPSTPSGTGTRFGRFCTLGIHLPGLWALKDSGWFFSSSCICSVGRGLYWKKRDAL